VVVAGAGTTAAAAVVTTAVGLASVGLGEGVGDTDGDAAPTWAAVADGVALPFPPPLTAVAIAVPPQHSTRNAAMMPRIRAFLPTFFFGGWAEGTDG
jgi:hypothetical protein